MSRGLDLGEAIDLRLLLRFMRKVDVGPGCWLWTGAKDGKGYGHFATGGGKRHRRAHVVSYAIFNGPVPAGLMVCHTCDVPSCVRPGHLFLGTAADNAADMVRKGRNRPGPGVRPPHTKLTDEVVRLLRSRPREQLNIRATARELGVSPRTVRFAIDGVTFRHLDREAGRQGGAGIP
jgi:hypothetical protein